MKKILTTNTNSMRWYAVFLAASALISMIITKANADVPMVRDGQILARIYLSPATDAPIDGEKPPLEVAAQELNYHLQKMSGVTLKIIPITDSSVIEGPAIVLGEIANKLGAMPQKTSVSKEGFRLLTKGNLLLIGGESDEGVLFGAYALLEKLGCDWVMPGKIGEIIPRRKTVTIPDLDESQSPDFRFRNMWLSGGTELNTAESEADFDVWKRRQRSGHYDPASLHTVGHAWEWLIPKYQKEFDNDPTMYALVRDETGKMVRRGPQVETTNPKIIDMFVHDIESTFSEKGWPKDKEVGFPIGPADTLFFSMSPESLAAGSERIDPITGELDRTDELILLANKIQERIEGEYPNVWLGFYSYSVYADYPLRYKPNPRIAITFAPITFSRFHSLLDPESKTQPYYRSVVEKWAKLAKEQGNQLIYRGYNWNLADNMLPYTKLHIWGEELPYYHRHGFIGLNIEAARSWSITGPSDWLFMKLAWNTNQDWKVLLNKYCRESFGDGWQPMQEYYLRLAERQRNAGQEAGSYHAFNLMYDDKFVERAERDFKIAKALAKTADQKTRIDYMATPIQTLKLYLAFHHAANEFRFADVEKYYDAIIAHHERVQAVKTDLVSPFTPIYLKRFLEGFARESHKYSSGSYRIVHHLPDAMPTLFDPLVCGDVMHYYAPQLNDSGYVKTKTYSTTWDAQGLANVRGAVWYRDHFKLPESMRGERIGLFLGGFDDEAHVWLNGKYIGSSGQVFSKPTVFDLSDAINWKGENVLAIQVVHSTVNELGTGGLIRPSFLFSSPPVKTEAKQK